MRRTMRDARSRPAPTGAETPSADRSRVEGVCGLELRRLRTKLWSEDPAVAARGASQLLELVEPSTLEEALDVAFGGTTAPVVQRAQVEQAWDSYRHDRYRALN